MDWNNTVDRLHELEDRHRRAHLPPDYQPLNSASPLTVQNLRLELCERDHQALHDAIVATRAGLMEMGIEIQTEKLGTPDQWLVDALIEFKRQYHGWHFDGTHWWAPCALITTVDADQLEFPIS